MKRFLASAILIAGLGGFACAEDPDPLPAALIKYQIMCPSGKNVCYGNCGTTHDTNRNGTIDASELPEFNTCTSSCNSACDLTAIYLAISD